MLRAALLLLLLTLLASWPQWSLPEWHGTEGRRLQVALEMVRGGDWLVPTLGGQPTWAKPPLHYWLLGGLGEVLGHGTWAMRLPSVLSLFAAAALAMELLRRWFG
ncbi:MAG: glycosyltransferase family 39 protein, partial [Planctomycetes bacterium]|nr:glycosyltransferase family 39 protein [Planctomycetota bacterium]